MQASEKEAIKLMRSQIPIGLSEAVNLLKKHNFDINLVLMELKENSIKKFASKNSVSLEEAHSLLISNGWRHEKALQSLEQQRLTSTEGILQYSWDDRITVSCILSKIVDANPFLRQYIFFRQESLAKLPVYQGKFITLCEWLNYIDFKGVEKALYLEHNQSIISILYELEMEEYANAIINAQKSTHILHLKYGKWEDLIKDFSKYVKFRNALGKDPAFAKCDELFRLNREPIYQRLVAFVKAHKEDFPK